MRFERYKEVELSWLKEVPSHWDVRRIASVFEQRKERNKPIKTEEILSLSAKYGVSLYSERKEKGGNKPKEDISNYNICHEGDILVNCMNIVAGSVGMSQYYGAISPVYYALKIIDNNSDKRYMEYVFRNYNFQRSLVGTGKGIQMSESDDGRLFTVRMRIAYDSLKVQNVPIPPLQEQEQIADFLDWKINEIDRLISLENKKIIETSNLASKSIEDYVFGRKDVYTDKAFDQYKGNDLIWIKSLPGHWKVERGKFLFNKENRPIFESDEVVTCFRDGEVTLRKNRRLDGFTESLLEIGYQGVRKGDLVIHVMDAFAGAIGISDSDGKSTPVYNVCTAKKDINLHYYSYVLRCIAKNGFIESLSRGIRERSSDFRFDVFSNLFFPVPSKIVQDAIVNKIENLTEKIKSEQKITKKKIEYLENLKQSLISEVVTGKVDIRDIVVPDYDKINGLFEEDEEQVEEGGESEWD